MIGIRLKVSAVEALINYGLIGDVEMTFAESEYWKWCIQILINVIYEELRLSHV